MSNNLKNAETPRPALAPAFWKNFDLQEAGYILSLLAASVLASYPIEIHWPWASGLTGASLLIFVWVRLRLRRGSARTPYVTRILWLRFVASLLTVAVLSLGFLLPIDLSATLSWSTLFVGLSIVLFPYERLSTQRHRHLLSALGLHDYDLPTVESWRQTRLLVFHLNGALYHEIDTIDEVFIDTQDLYQEREIEEALALLGNDKHPLGRALQKRFPSPPKLLRRRSLRVMESMGVEAQLKDPSDQSIHAVLGTYTWHKMLRHEISAEGLAQLQAWRDEDYDMAFLSFNKKIVAIIGWSRKPRPHLEESLQALNNDGYWMTTLSASMTMPKSLPISLFKASEVAVTKLEREVLWQRWRERTPHIFEVPKPLEASGDLRSIVWALRHAKGLFADRIYGVAIGPVLIVLSFSLPRSFFAILVLCAFFAFSAWSEGRSANQEL